MGQERGAFTFLPARWPAAALLRPRGPRLRAPMAGRVRAPPPPSPSHSRSLLLPGTAGGGLRPAWRETRGPGWLWAGLLSWEELERK